MRHRTCQQNQTLRLKLKYSISRPQDLRQNWTTDSWKTTGTPADFGGLSPTRFSCACAEAGETLKKIPCGRAPTQPPHHRHPTMAGRAPCSAGHVSKGHCTLSNNEFSVYFLYTNYSRSTPQGFFLGGGAPPGAHHITQGRFLATVGGCLQALAPRPKSSTLI